MRPGVGVSGHVLARPAAAASFTDLLNAATFLAKEFADLGEAPVFTEFIHGVLADLPGAGHKGGTRDLDCFGGGLESVDGVFDGADLVE